MPQVTGFDHCLEHDLVITYGMLVKPGEDIKYLDTVYDMPAKRNEEPKPRKDYLKSEFQTGVVLQMGIECGALGVSVGDTILYKRRAANRVDFDNTIDLVPTHAYVGRIKTGCEASEQKKVKRVSIVDYIAGWFSRK